MTDETFCPKCKSDKIIVQKVKQPDGSMAPRVIMGDIPAFNSGPQGKNIARLPYSPYLCRDCYTIFGVVELGPMVTTTK